MSVWIDLWELFFPRYCVVCGHRLSKNEEFLCVSCLVRLPRTNYHLHPDNKLEKNLWGKIPLEHATAFLYYGQESDSQKLLYELKYYGNSNLGVFLGRWMASELRSSGMFQGIDCIVPVPLHVKKVRKRGYNQSEMLAQGISSVTGIPVCSQSLVRRQYTDTQTKKGVFARWMNVQDVFECTSLEAFEGKHILLVDDVVTTGATLVACADALAGASRLRVSVLALALAGAR